MRISDWSSDVCSSVLGISSAVICRSRDAPLDQQRKAPVRRWRSADDDAARTPDLHRRAGAIGRDRARSLAAVGDAIIILVRVSRIIVRRGRRYDDTARDTALDRNSGRPETKVEARQQDGISVIVVGAAPLRADASLDPDRARDIAFDPMLPPVSPGYKHPTSH